MQEKLLNILLVEDNESDIFLTRQMLTAYRRNVRFVVNCAGTLADAVKTVKSFGDKTDAVLLDMGLPDSSGVKTIKAISLANPAIPIVVLTGMDDEETGLMTIQNGASDYLVKDKLTPEILGRTLIFAIERRQTTDEKRRADQNATIISSIFLAAPVGIALVKKRIFNKMNEQVSQISGYSIDELAGKSSLMLYPTETEYHRIGVLLYGDSDRTGFRRVETKWKRKDGALIDVLLSASPLDANDPEMGEVIMALDITESKRSEEAIKKAYRELEKAHTEVTSMQTQIIQSEKLASIGQLAAGVAHEMNTPVGFVASNFETLEKYIEKFKKLIEMYESLSEQAADVSKERILEQCVIIKNTAKEMKVDFMLQDIDALFSESKEGLSRVTTIIQSLRDFSRIDQAASFEKFDVNHGIESTLAVARNTLKYHADVITEFADLPIIFCSGSQINQVFLNILVNAAHAIESQRRTQKGLIKIKTCVSDNKVVCEIQDDGPGIAPEHLQKIYEPFFTTKLAGKGTGLGLSVSYDIIVNKHKGELLVDSELGKGAKFTIKLPITSAIDQQNSGECQSAQTQCASERL